MVTDLDKSDQTSSFGAASLENQRPHHSNWKLDRERSEMTEMTDDSLNESPVEVTNVGTTLPWLEVNNHTQGRLTSGHARDLVVRPNIKAIANGGILFGRVDGRDTEGQFIAYRRNYISITTACSLDNFHSMAPIYLDDKQVKAFGSELSSYIEDSSSISVKGRPVEMYQYTPKRDNKNRRPPDIIKVTPGLPLGTRNMKRENDLGRRSRSFGLGRCHDVQLPDLPLQLVPDEGVPVGTSSPVQDFGMKSPLVDAISNTSSYHHTWSRIQFKRATANNGQRRPTQQYFRLVITLLADVRPDNALRPVWVPVADLTSERIIVRGRSPIHYATDNVVANGKDNGREENDSDEARKGNSRKRKRLDEDIGHVNEHEDTGQSPGICHSDNEEIRKNSSSSSYDSSLDDVTYSTGFRSLNDNNNMNNINYNHMSNDTYSAYLSYNGSSSFSFNNCYPSIAPTPMSMFWRSDNPQSDFRNLSNNYNAMSFTSDPTTHDTSYEVKHASLSKLDTFPRSLTCNPAWYLDNNQPPQQSTQLHSQSQSQMQDNHQNRQSGDQQVQQSFDTSPLSLSYHNYHHSRDQYDQTLEPPLQSQVQSQVHPQIQSQSQLYRQNYDTVQYQNISSPLLYNSLNTRDQTSDSNNNNNNNDILFGSRSIRSNGYINGTGNNLLDVSR